ncbi:MAG TPA: tol-pal system protein YbgF [Gammaproteobacteria bacterium]|nr:tol-pal system protein YbgF [Gammaproteobacteria bacterium]
MKYLDKLIKALVFSCAVNAVTLAYGQNVPVIDLNDDQSQGTPAVSAPMNQPSPRDSLSVKDRLRLLEQQMDNLVQMNLPAKIDNLQQQLQQLNGQLEVQAHDVQALSDQQKSFYQDINQRLGNPKSAKTNTTNPGATATTPADTSAAAGSFSGAGASKLSNNTTDQIAKAEANVTQNNDQAQNAQVASQIISAGSEDKAYQSAFDLLVNKKTAAATTAFQEFLKAYPNGSYAPNAHYWLGELYSQQNKNPLAAKEFTAVIQRYPQHAKVPDAMLKLAIIHDEAGLHTQAQQELQKLIQKFPESTAARLAGMRLQQMKSTGGIQAQASQ